MILNKHVIRGKKGKTVCYSLPGFRFDTSDNKLKWEAFRFYTPLGESIDDNGYNYFDVPADEALIEREYDLNKEMDILVTKDNGVEILEILAGAEMEGINIGLEGDIVASGYIPSSTHQEIVFDYKEVIDG